ncbi:MAG: hypothetical protein IJW94_06035 [Oscillospiraceae bacterium]|nr:hypothetical protein [Oscillospiraceae bacterium]
MKKTTAIFMCIALCLSLMGCSNSDAKKSESNTPSDAISTDSVVSKQQNHSSQQPDDTQPDDTQPDDTQPDDTQPDDTQPDDTQPDDTQPDDTQPVSTQPDDTQPSPPQSEPTVHTHNYDQEIATAEYLKANATCANAAEFYYSCRCGQKGIMTFTSGSAIPHSYTATIHDATCSTEGYTEHKCTCGDSYKDNFTPVTHDHEFVSGQKQIGSAKYGTYVCKNCDIQADRFGNADGSLCGGNDDVKYYITYTASVGEWGVVFSDYHIVIYGSGAMPNFSMTNPPLWADYLDKATKVTVAEGITTIGTYAFYCPDGSTEITFNMADSVKTIKANSIDLNMWSITLGKGVERIESGISGKNLTGIYLPRSVKYFGSFGSSWKPNTKIYYEGTKEEFLQINTMYYNQTVTLEDFFDAYYSKDVYSPWCRVYLNCTKVFDSSNYFDTLKEWK